MLMFSFRDAEPIQESVEQRFTLELLDPTVVVRFIDLRVSPFYPLCFHVYGRLFCS